MRILQIPDSPWSIGQLCGGIRKYNPHHKWEVLYIPPRDIPDNLEKFKEMVKHCDLVDFQYWNVARQLIQYVPEGVKTVLTHHNQKNLLSADWSKFDLLTCKTNKAFKILNDQYPGKVLKIENTVDHEYFKWIPEYPPAEFAIGYQGRISPWKGLKELAAIAYEEKIALYVMGRPDKFDYWQQIPQIHKDWIRWDFFDCKDDERRDFYSNISAYIGNSNDGREEGTLGFLEALACGVPVITTPSGMAADIVKNGESAIIVPFEDKEALREAILRFRDMSLEEKNRLRNAGWQQVKLFNWERMARDFEKAYYQALYKEPLVSVIIPATYDRLGMVATILERLKTSNYEAIEAVIIWDEMKGYNFDEKQKNAIAYINGIEKFTVKQIVTDREGYNLAMARNLGAIEAAGEVLMFCDSRLAPEAEAIKQFVDKVMTTNRKTWVFGDKGGGKRDFVENFSAIKRQYFINGGMCNERITGYGGMSQELRSRFERQAFTFEFVPYAKATELKSSKLTPERRESIIKIKNILYKLGL